MLVTCATWPVSSRRPLRVLFGQRDGLGRMIPACLFDRGCRVIQPLFQRAQGVRRVSQTRIEGGLAFGQRRCGAGSRTRLASARDTTAGRSFRKEASLGTISSATAASAGNAGG